MKTATFILASIVLFLSTQCMEYSTETSVLVEKKCCSKKKSCSIPKGKEPKDDCKTVCNPFMVCSGCVYETCVKEILTVPSVFQKSVLNGFKKDLFISAYISSPWNPPEFI